MEGKIGHFLLSLGVEVSGGVAVVHYTLLFSFSLFFSLLLVLVLEYFNNRHTTSQRPPTRTPSGGATGSC